MPDLFIPMLAQPHKTLHPDVSKALDMLSGVGKWYFDEKYDGIRAVAYIDNGEVKLINRRMVDITFRYPEITTTLSAAFSNRSVVLDGEVVCFKDDGEPDFALTHRRDAQQSAASSARLVADAPASFVTFDILRQDDDDLTKLPFVARHKLLRVVVDEDLGLLRLANGSNDAKEMWDFITEHGREGLIAKQLTSLYVPGRSSSWVKLKPTKRLSAIVVGHDRGEGSRASTFGALHLTLLDENAQPRTIGKVGTGFKAHDLATVLELLEQKQPFIVDVEYQDLTSGGQLRFPSFKGIRTDIGLLECTVDQLERT